MILATEADRPAIEAFLKRHIATSMFPLSNLRVHGMAGGHPRAVRFLVRWRAGMLTDVLTVSDDGILFPQCPTAPWGEVKVVLAGMLVRGFVGGGAEVGSLRQALRLTDHSGIDTVEPLYRLSLTDVQMPDVTGFTLGPLADAPRKLVEDWRRAYLEEVLPMPGEDLQMKAVHEIADYVAANSHRVLYDKGVPVAMTGFNAALPDVVQIGGVYTPPERRNRGLARRAVALHLAEARASGVDHAILVAASTQAARAYEAVGFVHCGDFALVNFEKPQVIYG